MEQSVRIATGKPGMGAIFQAVHPNRHLWWAAAIFAILCIEGCVTAVTFDPAPQPCPASFCGAILNKQVTFRVSGRYACELVRLKFGDGTFFDGKNVDFGATGATQLVVTHTYRGWPGRKTATAEGVTNCFGSATLQGFPVLRQEEGSPITFSSNVRIGFGPTSSTCSTIPIPNLSPLRKNTTVKIRTNPDPNVKINFGCLGGCFYDADGTTLNAPAGYPFPGFKELSLVLRVGTQVVQGGTDMSFITNQSGPLELCVNDYKLSDNTGAWGIFISVDESLAP